MIDFIVCAAPRSGTAWVSNWLTTDTSLCYHDPLFEMRYEDLDLKVSSKRIGISCTGAALFPEWFKAHKAKKLIIHRPAVDINASLGRLGLGFIGSWDARLNALEGWHIEFHELFTKPKSIYEYLLELPFDAERHALLCKLNIQRDTKFLNDDSQRGLANAPHVHLGNRLPKGSAR